MFIQTHNIQGTGALGAALISSLLAANFTVTCILRPTSTSQPPAGVATKRSDYNDVASLTAALHSQDALVEAFNPSAAVHQRTILAAALAAGVRHIITPDFSGDTFHPKASELLIFNPKIQAQRELEAVIAEAAEKLSWTAIVTGPWYDWTIAKGIFWVDKNRKVITRYGSGDQKCSVSRHALNGEALVAVLQNPEKYRNRPAYFASHTVSTNKIIDIVNELGLEGWRVVDVPFDGLYEKAHKMWREDTEKGVVDRLNSKAYAALSTVALLDEENRYGSNFEDLAEAGWDEGEVRLREELRRLLA
ncbi:NAD(P)-binding protein [Colletotrichum plurivorum]|uniref:NAD(P)-binding protein n=1 Tax=Colletotrichum plurivorum TaxID=2175906 RepID=A0A8H6MZV8_9PEZI|nr:NAD(P)-binding protein [Colletotrichum plurivorum]